MIYSYGCISRRSLTICKARYQIKKKHVSGNNVNTKESTGFSPVKIKLFRAMSLMFCEISRALTNIIVNDYFVQVCDIFGLLAIATCVLQYLAKLLLTY